MLSQCALLLGLSMQLIVQPILAQSVTRVDLNATRIGTVLQSSITSSGELCSATVLTQYLQYNNTAITSTTTLYNTGAVESVEVPSGIIPDHGEMEYSRTYVSTATAVAFPLTTIASPTPFNEVLELHHANGTIVTEGGRRSCSQWPTDPLKTPDFYDFDPGFIWVEEPTIIHTEQGFALPTGTQQAQMLSYWISQTPTITQLYPDLASCTAVWGSGQPSVHVVVTALTEHASTTVQMSGPPPAQITSPPNPPVNNSPFNPSSNLPSASSEPPSNSPNPPSNPSLSSNKPSSSNPLSWNNPPFSKNPPSSNNHNSAPAPLPITLGNNQVLTIQPPTQSGGPAVILPGGEILQPGHQTIIGFETIVLPSSSNTVASSNPDGPINAAALPPAIQIIDASNTRIVPLPIAQTQNPSASSTSTGGVREQGSSGSTTGAMGTITGLGAPLRPSTFGGGPVSQFKASGWIGAAVALTAIVASYLFAY